MPIITRSKSFVLYSNKENSQVRMYVTQGEFATTLADFTLYDGTTVLDLTGASEVLFSVYQTDNRNTAVALPVEISNASQGKITVATTQEMSATYDGAGMDCYVQVIYTNKVVKFSGMKIYVKKDPTLDIIAQSPNAQTLINALNKLAMIDAGTGTIEIDDVLSAISTNPVQNKKITQKINEMDNYLSGYSFLYDSFGRIYSYTWDTSITKKVQGVTNGSFGNDVNRNINCYVWLSKNVVSVEEDSLPDVQYIKGIRCEGDVTLPEQYNSLGNKVQRGRSSLSVFYMLASLAFLYNSKLEADDRFTQLNSQIPHKISDLTNDSDFLIPDDISGKEDSSNKKTTIPSNLSTEDNTYPTRLAAKQYIDNLLNALEQFVTGEINQIKSNANAEAATRASGDQALSTRITTEETARQNAISGLQAQLSGKISNANGTVKENNINDGAVTKAKLTTALKNEIDNKIDSEDGVLFIPAQNADNCYLQNVLYVLQSEVAGHIQNTHTMIVSADIDNRAQYRYSVEGGFEYRTQTGLIQEGNPWSEWKSFATASDVTEIDGELSDLLQNLSNNYYTITEIDNLLATINSAITNLTNTVELKANKAADIDDSVSVATIEETQYPSVAAIKRFVTSHIYRKTEIDGIINGHIHNAEMSYGLPISVGFDMYKIPIKIVEGNYINKNMIADSTLTTLFIASNVTEVSNDILDGSNIKIIYVDMDLEDGSALLENVEGLSNVNYIYYRDSNFNFNRYLANALLYIRNLILGINNTNQRIEAKADKATTYQCTVTLDKSAWDNNLQSIAVLSPLYTINQNTVVTMKLSELAKTQLDSCGCESISVETVFDDELEEYILTFEVEGETPTTNITVDLWFNEVVDLTSQ